MFLSLKMYEIQWINISIYNESEQYPGCQQPLWDLNPSYSKG